MSVSLGLHSRLLLLAGTGAAILASSAVELPGEVKGEGAAGGIAGVQLARAIDGSPGLAGVEQVHAACVDGQ